MSDSVANTTLHADPTHLVISSAFTIDGTEATVTLADKSAHNGPDGSAVGRFVIEKLEYHINGMQVSLQFDHDTDDEIATLSGHGCIDFTDGGRFQGFIDPNSTGGSGDITATTLNSDAGDTSHIVLFLRKKD